MLQNYELSVNRATERLNYYVSGGFYDQDGIAQNSSFRRYNMRANAEVKASNWLIFGLFLVEEAAYGNSVEQIEFCVGLADEIGVSFLLKIFPDGRTYQSPVACYIYFGIFV